MSSQIVEAIGQETAPVQCRDDDGYSGLGHRASPPTSKAASNRR